MSFLKSFKPKYLQLFAFLVASLFSQILSATQMGPQWSMQLAAGSRVIISLDPPLPRRAEPFTVNVSGTWRNPCIAGLGDLKVNLIFLDRPELQRLRVGTYPPSGCGDEYEPTPFTRSVEIPGSVWESIDEKIPLLVSLGISDIAVPHYWFRKFDLSWGLHEIPPQIGQGHWISDESPFQGLNVEQQGDTVLVYELGYREDDGEPDWLMGNARFHGDITHGVAYHVRWLNPTGEWDYETRDYVQPKEDEMSFTQSSFGIGVEGVNRIKVFLNRPALINTYKRYVFRLADNQLPVVVPDMVGQWNLYAFDNQNLEASFLIEFRAATKSERGVGLYRFNSIDDQWVLECWVNLDGVGTCDLTNEDLGITMSYTLLDFNGNYAKAPLLTTKPEETTQTGILLRAGFHLPVLDFQ